MCIFMLQRINIYILCANQLILHLLSPFGHTIPPEKIHVPIAKVGVFFLEVIGRFTRGFVFVSLFLLTIITITYIYDLCVCHIWFVLEHFMLVFSIICITFNLVMYHVLFSFVIAFKKEHPRGMLLFLPYLFSYSPIIFNAIIYRT